MITEIRKCTSRICEATGWTGSRDHGRNSRARRFWSNWVNKSESQLDPRKILASASALEHDFSMPELKDFASSVAIIVSSCDAFFDAWRPFVFFFRKHWSDCPFPVYLIVNRLRVRSNIVQPIAVGPDRDWASNMATALAVISQPY